MIARLSRLLTSRSVVSGAMLYVGMRWFDRLIGVISTVVLARLLTPDDFGIVALASIVLGLAMVFLDLGVNISIVQKGDVDRDDLDTAWSLRLLQNVVVAGLLAAAGGFVASYYEDGRLQGAMYALAIAYLIDGLTGMGPIVFQKRQEYAREVAFFMAKRSLGFLATAVLAFWLRNYWALLIGTVVGNAIGVILSYAMHRVAPRFTLVKWREFLGASIWLASRSVGFYVGQQLDKLVIGRRDGAATLGAYAIADQVAAMPTSELLAPLSRALFPALAAAKDDKESLRRMFLLSLGIQSTVALPASVGIAFVADDLIHVMLGSPWVSAAPMLTALALAYGANALTHSGGYLLTALGRFGSHSGLQWLIVGLLAALVFLVYPASGATEIMWMRTALGGVNVLGVAVLTIYSGLSISTRDLITPVVRPALACSAMSLLLFALVPLAEMWSPLLRLSLTVLVGVLTYGVSLIVVWYLLGRPDGAEAWILEKLRRGVARA